MQIQDMNFTEFKDYVGRLEGIVLLGCGGDLQEWITGTTQSLFDNDVTFINDSEALFMSAVKLTTTGGRTDLALVFKNNAENLQIGKMAMWRLQFGDCSWISDYLSNYANQHGFVNSNDDSDFEDEDE